MKKSSVILLAGVTAVTCLAVGCGKSSESESEISDISVAYESVATETDTTATETYVDDETAPGDGYVRSALTNEWVTEDVANSRPIAVMMPTDSEAQPQYNIGNAGILYECMEEGSISRQMAIIEGWQDMEQIGNIRSCRRYYIYPAMEWDSILVHFGGVFYMQDLITLPEVNNISGTYEYGTGGDAPGNSAFFRTTEHSSPHNAYTSGANLTEAIESLGYDEDHRSDYYDSDHFTFTNASNPNTLDQYSDAVDASEIDLQDVFPVTKSYLKYDADEGVYYKWLHNEEQVDATTDEQLSFSNVIIQFTDTEVLDEKGYLSIDMLSGGDGYYCTEGKCIPITWSKGSSLSDGYNYAPTKYYDMDGNEITLNTGKTYIAIAETGTEPVFD